MIVWKLGNRRRRRYNPEALCEYSWELSHLCRLEQPKQLFSLQTHFPIYYFSPRFLRLMFYFGEIAEFQSANAEMGENVGAVLRRLFSVRVQVLPPAAAADKSCLFSTREGEFSCRPVTCSPYRCLHNSAITGITSHRSMWQNLVNPNISLREEITLLQSMLVKEGMTRDICCLVGVKGFYGRFFFSSPPLP